MNQKEATERLAAFGIDLLEPHGLRKYFYLEFRLAYRYRLGKTWEEARGSIRRGVVWLVENYEPVKADNDDPPG